ncbi:MAG TPA: ATP-binding protein [Planctomycetota bacterium]|nr:ATP-binding protein [Planctomycetota bacterium]
MSDTALLRRRIRFGFGLVVILAGAVAFVALFTLRSVIDSKDLVIQDYAQDMVQTRDLVVAAEQVAASSRAYLLTGDSRYLDQEDRARRLYRTRIELLRSTADFPEEYVLLDKALAAARDHQEALDQALGAESRSANPQEIAKLFEARVQPRSQALHEALNRLVTEKDRWAGEALLRSRREATRATILVATLGGATAALAAGLFFLSFRTLKRLERAEREVSDLNETLEQRVTARTREIEGFAYSIAHDLRAPLRTMAGMGEIVLEDYGNTLDATGRDALGRIRNAAIRMDDLIAGLLGLARFSYEVFPLTTVDVADIVRETIASQEETIRSSGARVESDVASLRARAHPFLAKVALSQLVSNALKFVVPGVTPRLRLRTERRGDRIRIVVADNGIGIAPEYHARIFGMFQRLHTNEAYPGVGVGLTLAQRAADRMGGSVGLDSRYGGGSTFWIELAADQPTTDSSTSRTLEGARRS